MWRLCALMSLCLAISLASPLLWAQAADDIDQQFKKISPEEEVKLRAVLAESAPENVANLILENHLNNQYVAAQRLGDQNARFTVLKEMVAKLPGGVYRNNLARAYANIGDMEEAKRWQLEAISLGTPFEKGFWLGNLARDYFVQFKIEDAKKTVEEAEKAIAGLENRARGNQQLVLARTQASLAQLAARIEQRLGKSKQALEWVDKALSHSRNAFKLSNQPNIKRNVLEDMATNFELKMQIEQALNLNTQAEKTLQEYLRVAKENELPQQYLSRIYRAAGGLEFDLRRFAAARDLAMRADAVLQKLGFADGLSSRTSLKRDLAMALSAQKKYDLALAQFNALDSIAGNDERIKKIVLYQFERAWVYLNNQKFSEAESLFGALARGNAALYGAAHFFTAQAEGLQGVALWNSAQINNHEASKARALALMSSSVANYMATANADFLGDSGLRREMREMVFATYLEAAAEINPTLANAAISAADWVRSGSVQDALTDAAVRAVATGSAGPVVADLVRKEQDAKNEVKDLRNYLASAGSSGSPEIVKRIRNRIAELDGTRTDLQKQIKVQFPDYDNLVRPGAPTVADIQAKLRNDEAMLMLLPTDKATYVWSVTKQGGSHFYRAPVGRDALDVMVKRLRSVLDLGAMDGKLRAFEGNDASELYRLLLQPLESHFKDKTELVINAGGVLGQIPFALLQTGGFKASTNASLKDAPWLIKQAAVTHVPSVGSWLALQGAHNRKVASQALMAWGDPVFDLRSAQNKPKGAVRALVMEADSKPAADLEKELDQPSFSSFDYATVPPLPDTRDELLVIAEALKAHPNDLVMGREATRESVLKANSSGILQNKRVIAFATHGLKAGDIPNLNQPALAMAATGNELREPMAPLLLLEDVLSLKLNADWVVLSACNTAAADGKGEEALSGLARGFFYAGAKSMLVTHWSVESVSAKDLTTAVFEHYTQNSQALKAQSMRHAMLKVMQSSANPDFAHPAFWAPYALVGDGGR